MSVMLKLGDQNFCLFTNYIRICFAFPVERHKPILKSSVYNSTLIITAGNVGIHNVFVHGKH